MFEAYPIADRLSAREARGPLHVSLLVAWDKFRPALGAPVEIVSGYRSPEGNASIGGSPRSQHMLGLALDIACPTVNLWSDDVFSLLLLCGFRGIGRELEPGGHSRGGRTGRFHIDTRPGPFSFWRYPEAGSIRTEPDHHAFRCAKLILGGRI